MLLDNTLDNNEGEDIKSIQKFIMTIKLEIFFRKIFSARIDFTLHKISDF